MADSRFEQVERLYHEALSLPAPERAGWLATACGDDEGVRREVEDLLRYDAAEAPFLERSALVVAAGDLARDRQDALVGRRLGGYEILAPLGSGGMGDVYRARDLRLGREAALKVLDGPAPLDPVGRLEAEARAASALNHPHIVTIYGVGEEDGTAYIAMELVRGRSLRDLVSEAPLPAPTVLEIAAQLADAIAAAHASGIVHRDLKPENVMVSAERRVKVLDFGIAALLDDASALDAGRGSIGSEGLVGTVGYMSPEQARGGAAGPASDQFALGVICYEMLTGRRPFERASPQDTLTAIAAAEPPAPVALAGPLAPFAAIVSRCLAREPEQRYRDTGELRDALLRLREQAGTRSAPAHTRRRVLLLAAVAAAAAAAGVVGRRLWPGSRTLASIAVLPFDNSARDVNAEYLCDGITATLIRQLAEAPSLTVIARATAFRFKGVAFDPTAVGQQLSVDATLTGSVERRAGRLLVSAELVESATGARLWGGDFDRPVADVLGVQNEIAREILSRGIGLDLRDREQAWLAAGLTDDAAAYELFLRAVHHLRLGGEEDYLAARGLLTEAVGRAPRFALAHVTLASTYSVMAVDGFEAPSAAWPESERHVRQALTVAPELADAHAEAASLAFFHGWDWSGAERHWSRALGSRTAVQSELLTARALQMWALGDTQAALEMARAARQTDPLSAQAAVREADILAGSGRVEEAVAAYERVIRDQPEDSRAHFGLAEARRRQGRFDAAITALRTAHAVAGDAPDGGAFEGTPDAAGYEALVRASARRELERLSARERAGGYVSPLDRARAFAELGDASQAFAHLAAALAARAPGVVLLKVDPAWEGLRADPRFAAAVARVGLP